MSTDIALPAVDYERKGRELIEEGFCVLEGMLGAGILRHTRDVAMGAVGELTEEQSWCQYSRGLGPGLHVVGRPARLQRLLADDLPDVLPGRHLA